MKSQSPVPVVKAKIPERKSAQLKTVLAWPAWNGL